MARQRPGSRVIGRFLRRTFWRPARPFIPLLLVPALAIGSLTLSPPSAYASIPQVSTPLPQGRTIPSRAVAFGSTIVWDTLRSSDTGANWTPDAALADRPSWDFVGGGKMARAPFSGGATTTAVVYTPATGGVQTYTIASDPDSVNATYASYYDAVRDLATNTPTLLAEPAGAAGYWRTHELSSSNALLWHGTLDDGSSNLFAAAPTQGST